MNLWIKGAEEVGTADGDGLNPGSESQIRRATPISKFWISRSDEEITPPDRLLYARPTMAEIYGTTRARGKLLQLIELY